ncbi:hypothetical protein [Mesorhizobium australicum]|uniref:Uncharacterized protein n=1 Tax=Mesorhizobium australicum TaxID=536018 RepID=A0A1X7PGP6_9HYPH|nr:hypothetical protein [Mesorhizobium australicum]SMH50683.1 hypothetical protein SAMN02982922_4226 [Mesorhizobium australicum]
MANLLKTAFLSALIGLGALGAAPASAQSGVYLGLGGGHHGPSVGVWFGDSGHSYRRYDRRHDRRWEHRRGCSAGQALNKAERMGIRHARVVDIDRRSVDVRGRKYGERVRVSFARAPGCPLIY